MSVATQRNLYRHYLRVIAADTGYTPEELHDIFRQEFLRDFADEGLGVRSTTTLDKQEYHDYIEKIRRFMADFGIQLGDTEEGRTL